MQQRGILFWIIFSNYVELFDSFFCHTTSSSITLLNFALNNINNIDVVDDEVHKFKSGRFLEQKSWICESCNKSHNSRNLYYGHLRQNNDCLVYLRNLGINIDLNREKKKLNFAILVAYNSTNINLTLTSYFRKALVADDVELLAISGGTDTNYRLSSLLKQEYDVGAAGDIIVFSIRVPVIKGFNMHQWTLNANNIFPSNIKILAFEQLNNHATNLHAEQHCTAREYEYILPASAIYPLDIIHIIDDTENNEITNEAHDDEKKLFWSALRIVLRSLSTEKMANGGGYKFRRSKPQHEIRNKQRWHNFCDVPDLRVVPTDSAVQRVVDRFSVVDCQINGKPYFKFRIRGDGFLRQQVRRMIGTAICILHGWLPQDFAVLALDPTVIIETPCAPSWLYLYSCKYDWYRIDGKELFSQYADSIQAYANLLAMDLTDSMELDDSLNSWLDEMKYKVCPRIRLQYNTIMKSQKYVPNDTPVSITTDKKITTIKDTNHIIPENLVAATEKDGLDSSTTIPSYFLPVLNLLRAADQSGKWPATTRARSQVMRVVDVEKGGSFSVGRPVVGLATPRGNSLFPELTEAVFELEKLMMPDRPPSTMVAINRRANFLPHTDAGAGYGQSTSLIVGLGDYEGGALAVEGEFHDIRYKPLTFDGWRQRHWTLPFVGERFSLVWFTPKEVGMMIAEEDQESDSSNKESDVIAGNGSKTPIRYAVN